VSAAEERLADHPMSELWGEHRARYRFALQWAAGQRVLDIACGAGFGLRMLREAGARGVGIDYDLAALHGHDQVACADAAHLPVSDATFDLVVSFETLEHVPNARAMLRELRRVLRPGGQLVLSTPNRDFRTTSNPFHVQEFTAAELRSLLCESFAEVRIHGQYPTASYRFVPFLMRQPHWWDVREVAWKVLNRLPYRMKNRLGYALSGQPWYPDETAYRFAPDEFGGAHALIAVAR
jgi:SAM-dependent methyltransferase